VNHNITPSFRRLFHHHHTLLMGVFSIVLCPLRCAFVMIHGIIVVHVVQLSIAQEAQLGAAATKVAVSVIHITETRGAAIVQSRAHICVMPLTMAQDAVAPLGALLVDMISAVLLALTAVEPLLTLTLPAIVCLFIAPLLGHVSDGGIVDKGGTNSTMITPCCSSNVVVAGMVVVTSLIMSPYGVINMATIICGSMCAGGGGRDNAHGG
jgi:hypothetical protein